MQPNQPSSAQQSTLNRTSPTRSPQTATHTENAVHQTDNTNSTHFNNNTPTCQQPTQNSSQTNASHSPVRQPTSSPTVKSELTSLTHRSPDKSPLKAEATLKPELLTDNHNTINNNDNNTATNIVSSDTAAPTDDELQSAIASILSTANLDELSVRAIRTQLAERFNCNLESRKKQVSHMVQFCLDNPHTYKPEAVKQEQDKSVIDEDEGMETEQAEQAETQEELDRRLALQLQAEDRPPRRRAALVEQQRRAAREARDARWLEKKKSGKAKPPAQMCLSLQLAEFFDGQDRMSRGDVVRNMWSYIKTHNLQNPNDKREILLDDKMKGVFGEKLKTVTMFSMNKHLAKHIKKHDEII